MGAMICVMAVAAGMVASFREAMLIRNGTSSANNAIWQRAALLIAVGCVVMALVMINNGIGRMNSFVLRFAAAQLVFGIAALAVFGTRWRPMVEGLAAISAGVFSFLSGFSIGFFTMWIALLLGIVALIHSTPTESRRAGVNSG